MDRRAALGLLAGAAALVAGAQPSEAAYGDAARVFASGATNATGERRGGGAWARARGCMAAGAGPLRSPQCDGLPVCRRACPAGFIPYQGQGFALLIPSKWNPSKERDYPNVVFRCAGARRMRSGGAGCVGLQNGAAKGVQPAEEGGPAAAAAPQAVCTTQRARGADLVCRAPPTRSAGGPTTVTT